MHGGHEKKGKFLPPAFIYVWSHGYRQSEEVGSRSEEAQDHLDGSQLQTRLVLPQKGIWRMKQKMM